MEIINVTSLITSLLLAAVTGIGGYIISKIKGFGSEHERLLEALGELESMREELHETNEKIDAITVQVAALTADALSDARNSIVRICEDSIQQGRITESSLHALLKRYESYKTLGGNGFVDTLVDDAKTLRLVTEVTAVEA